MPTRWKGGLHSDILHLRPLTAQDIMGTNKANPTALILSATMMLRHLGLDTQANAIAEATYDLVREGKVRTADLGGNASTTDVTKAIIDRLFA